MLALSHYARMADSHRIKAINADTEHERIHWDAEAHRFEQLAEMERTDPAAARAAYRPTRAYAPDTTASDSEQAVAALRARLNH